MAVFGNNFTVPGGTKVGLTIEALIWFTILTAIGTIIGGIGYAYLQKYLPDLPASTTATSTRASDYVRKSQATV